MSNRPLRMTDGQSAFSCCGCMLRGYVSSQHPPRRGAQNIRESDERVARVLPDIRLVLDALEEVLGCSLVFSLCLGASRRIVVIVLALAILVTIHRHIAILALLLDALAFALLLCSSAVGLCRLLLGRLLSSLRSPDGSWYVEADLDTLVRRGPAELAGLLVLRLRQAFHLLDHCLIAELERNLLLVDGRVVDVAQRDGESVLALHEEREVVASDLGGAPVPAAHARLDVLERDVVVVARRILEALVVVAREALERDAPALALEADPQLKSTSHAQPLHPLHVARGHGRSHALHVPLPPESRRGHSELSRLEAVLEVDPQEFGHGLRSHVYERRCVCVLAFQPYASL